MKANIFKLILPTEVPRNFSFTAEGSRLYPKLDDSKTHSPHTEELRNFGYAFYKVSIHLQQFL